jgi:large subunit ribosomal protein L21
LTWRAASRYKQRLSPAGSLAGGFHFDQDQSAMYAVIETGGKQYRVKAGDLLIVDKLGGDVGAKVAFDRVLMLGDGAKVSVGAPTVAGAVVEAALIETRKGDKIKIFKKIRRQGYRRTGGHRQWESVLRVTAVTGAGSSDTWSGEVDLTPRAVLNARARGEKPATPVKTAAVKAPAKPKAAPKAEPKPAVVAAQAPEAKPAAKAPAKAAATKTPAAAKPAAKAETKAAPKAKAEAKPKAAPKAKPKAAPAPKAAAAKPPAKAAARKAPPAKKPAAKPAKPKA